MHQPSTFTVYNASAGSGKTFTLVKEYLKIILTTEDIFTFQKVLAITFTNKAAGEMKERVLHNLRSFSEGKSTSILDEILKETTLEKEVITQRSTKILQAILQNYAAFSITTIDSFTHKIIKSFAYDLDLPLNFEVELDAVTLLNEAVEVLISKIGTDKKITQLLIDYSLEKTDDDKSWDIANDLNEFAKILLSEDDIPHFRALSKKCLDDFTNLKQQLFQHQQQLKIEFQKVGDVFLELLQENQLQFTDFNRSTIPKFFNDIKNKGFDFTFLTRSETINKAIENHQYYTKSTSQEIATTIDGLVPQIIDSYEKSKAIFGQYLLNKLALKSLVPLAVLNNINNELETIKQENNILFNAEFNQRISDSLKEQPAAYIYERIGQRFQHYFIDEMQDTSVLQWQNLIPLIDNVLAQENSNLLLVGDAKQAIYRWRGGKAEQFIDLGIEEKNPFQTPKKVEQLGVNFRSYSKVIEFNNSFFKHIAQFLQNESYQELYKIGNNQGENDKKGGYVSLSFLERQEDKEEDKLRYAKKVLEHIKVLQNEFSLGEICVLTRTKKDGVIIADYLSENGVQIVSSETLLLQNNKNVLFLINFLKLMQNPTDEEMKFELLYFLHQHLQIQQDVHSFLKDHVKLNLTEIFKSLEDNTIYFSEQNYHQLPFYEKVETLIRVFQITKTSNAYLQFFLDVVLEQQRKGVDANEFLDFWELKKDKLSIVAPKSADAVQIMTIHKAKGLQFPVVIFPCDLDIYRQIKPKVWLDELPDSFTNFDELLVSYNKDLEYISNRSLAIYNEQKEALELDNSNLLYVALTRAVEQLYIITDKNVDKSNNENLRYYSGFFINYLKMVGDWKDDQLDYSFGDQNRISSFEKSEQIPEIHQDFISTPWQEHNIVLVTNASKLWNTEQGKAIDYGVLLHEMFAKINSVDDVEAVVNQYHQQGLLDDLNHKYIKERILEVVHHPQLKKYYKKDTIVYNEREIVDVDNQISIPDRLVIFNDEVIIIDYKTGNPSQNHHQQLLKYSLVLETMNFKVTKKILIYINDTIDVVEVLSEK